VMRDHRELPKLLVAHSVGSGEVTHIDDVGFKQLVYGRKRIGRIEQRRDHALIDCNKGMRHEVQRRSSLSISPKVGWS